MSIKWKTVTWYSQMIAIILFVGIFFLGFWLGESFKASSYVGTWHAPTTPPPTSR